MHQVSQYVIESAISAALSCSEQRSRRAGGQAKCNALVRNARAATDACSSTAAHASATCASAPDVTAATASSLSLSACAIRWSHSSVSSDSSVAAAPRASSRARSSSWRSWARSSSEAASASRSFSSSSRPVRPTFAHLLRKGQRFRNKTKLTQAGCAKGSIVAGSARQRQRCR